jgi:hypothetical protein
VQAEQEGGLQGRLQVVEEERSLIKGGQGRLKRLALRMPTLQQGLGRLTGGRKLRGARGWGRRGTRAVGERVLPCTGSCSAVTVLQRQRWHRRCSSSLIPDAGKSGDVAPVCRGETLVAHELTVSFH